VPSRKGNISVLTVEILNYMPSVISLIGMIIGQPREVSMSCVYSVVTDPGH
jgi:hypothetical protein